MSLFFPQFPPYKILTLMLMEAYCLYWDIASTNKWGIAPKKEKSCSRTLRPCCLPASLLNKGSVPLQLPLKKINDRPAHFDPHGVTEVQFVLHWLTLPPLVPPVGFERPRWPILQDLPGGSSAPSLETWHSHETTILACKISILTHTDIQD